jgi:hypothetical protein
MFAPLLGLVIAVEPWLGAAYTLTITLIRESDRAAVFGACVFYVVGATSGLADRLRRDSQADAAIDDYGLSTARLITVPLSLAWLPSAVCC